MMPQAEEAGVRLAEPLDQASGLRRLFAPEPTFQALGVIGPDSRLTASACTALALGLGRRGHRVMVMDETRPPNNVAALLGVLPRHGGDGPPFGGEEIDIADGVGFQAPGLDQQRRIAGL